MELGLSLIEDMLSKKHSILLLGWIL